MAQSYFANTHATVAPPVESPAPVDDTSRATDIQAAYVDHRDRLLDAIDASKNLLTGLVSFNKEDWTIRYPQFSDRAEPVSETAAPKRKHAIRRSMTFVDDPTQETEVVIVPRKNMARSMTLATVADLPEDGGDDGAPAEESNCLIPTSDSADMQVLKVELKMGPHGAGASPAGLVGQLEKTSIATLITGRLESAIAHVGKLRRRVEDPFSRVLVTGDLNAGKSTFVNALLRRHVMPVDQQPCTTAFCEVHDASENGDREEAHIVKDGAKYAATDDSTFTRVGLEEMDAIIDQNEDVKLQLKLYLKDKSEQSLLNNGVVDIALIDAPGLNRDSIKTTEIFSRQDDIDVIVFVVSAENHFTLSAKEFLLNASHEKAYVFIVVNKYDGIRNKDKCRRAVLEQIRQISPRTHDSADELVHFVDSAKGADSASFDALQVALRSFVLEKREKSKLAPVSTYLSNLLRDVELLAGSNAIVAQGELAQAQSVLERALPILEKMKKGREPLEDGLEAIEEDGARATGARARQVLDHALTLVGQGKPGSSTVAMPSYPGLLHVWEYVHDVRQALLASVDTVVKQLEDETRATASAGVQKVHDLGAQHLPDGAERTRREFMPEAMFRVRTRKAARRVSGNVGAELGLGLGLGHRPELADACFADLFDAHHAFWTHLGAGDADDDDKSNAKGEDDGVSALSVVSVGLGALTMVGGSAAGARGLVEGVLRVSDLLANESARRWAAPLLSAFTIGATAYFVLELPASIPRNAGRRIRRELVSRPIADGAAAPAFVDAHAERMAHEARKVLRLAGWDLKERFRGALDGSAKEVQDAQAAAAKATGAITFFRATERQAGEVRRTAGVVAGPL